jgi:protein gp37
VSSNSAIEWTGATWNPTRGCSRVSPGCEHCYAERFAHRFSEAGQTYAGLTKATPRGPRWRGVLREVDDVVDLPLRWRKPKLIFVNSMSDLFHEKVSLEFLRRVFETMRQAHWHTFQILTKRADRVRELASLLHWPSNVWMGVSVENEDYVERIDDLRSVPAAVRFLSLEPLLGPLPRLKLAGIHWAIVGGESGPGRAGDAPRVGAGLARPVRESRRGVLLQTVGWCPQGDHRARAGRAVMGTSSRSLQCPRAALDRSANLRSYSPPSIDVTAGGNRGHRSRGILRRRTGCCRSQTRRVEALPRGVHEQGRVDGTRREGVLPGRVRGTRRVPRRRRGLSCGRPGDGREPCQDAQPRRRLLREEQGEPREARTVSGRHRPRAPHSGGRNRGELR